MIKLSKQYIWVKIAGKIYLFKNHFCKNFNNICIYPIQSYMYYIVNSV